jgi:hydroxymethylglutaryl-CoA synthase
MEFANTSSRPTNIGILAAELYVPTRYVAQEDLEVADDCKGKYTVGLGQTCMAFTDDREDIASIIMTAVQQLMEKNHIDPADVGRLEVGTETLVDKAKSVKTSLMPLFGDNTDIEGITTVNACYGGTAALFNTVAWVESSDYDGRYAILVCADIAVYAKGNARPTGGCAAMAMLIGPNAPLALEPGVRASHFLSVYDFYKPHHSEYAAVDGKLSQWAYLSSVDMCYSRYIEKYARRHGPDAPKIDLSHFDHFSFHSPYNKLAQKGFARLFYVDFANKMAAAGGDMSALESSEFAAAVPFKDVPQADSYENRDIEAAFKTISSERYG